MNQRIKDIFLILILSFCVVSLFYLYFPLHWLDWAINQKAGVHVGSTITTINATDRLSDSRSTINTNFSNLNTDKLQSGDTAAALTITALTTNGITQNTTATSSFTGGISTLRINATGTSTVAGLQVTSGCVYFNGVCLGATTVSSVTAPSGEFTISPTTGDVTIKLATSTSFLWTASTTFSGTPLNLNAATINVLGELSGNVSRLLVASSTDKTMGNEGGGTASTTLLEYILPGNTLYAYGDNGMVQGRLNFTDLYFDQPNDQIYFEFKNGSNSIYTFMPTTTTASYTSVKVSGYLEFTVMGSVATNAQEWAVTFYTADTGHGPISTTTRFTSTFDSTTAQTMQIVGRIRGAAAASGYRQSSAEAKLWR